MAATSMVYVGALRGEGTLVGGPTAQDQHSFQFERQFFAANGYVVINPNYRGSAGRGAKVSDHAFPDPPCEISAAERFSRVKN